MESEISKFNSDTFFKGAELTKTREVNMQRSNEYKKLCLHHINRYKFALKIFIRNRERARKEYRVHKRAMNLLKAKNSPFDRSRIEHHAMEKDRYSDLIDDVAADIIRYAEVLKPWLYAYDTVSSFDEKASILGVSHIALMKKVNEYKEHDLEQVPIYEMIMVHHGEYHERRGEKDCLPGDNTRLPLFWSFLLRDRHLMKTDSGFRKAISKAFDEFFPGIPKYQQYTYSDGTTEMVRIPPELTIASNRFFKNDP